MQVARFTRGNRDASGGFSEYGKRKVWRRDGGINRCHDIGIRRIIRIKFASIY